MTDLAKQRMHDAGFDIADRVVVIDTTFVNPEMLHVKGSVISCNSSGNIGILLDEEVGYGHKCDIYDGTIPDGLWCAWVKPKSIVHDESSFPDYPDIDVCGMLEL